MQSAVVEVSGRGETERLVELLAANLSVGTIPDDEIAPRIVG